MNIEKYYQALQKTDLTITKIIEDEFNRQQNQVELIASENIVSPAVMAAQGNILTNKYAEGYPGKRYYGGCEYVDEIEKLAIERVKSLFKCNFANVQPHSGSQANQAAFLALLQPGDTILGMSLNSGGHLTHGAAPNLSGKWFNIVQYDVDHETYLIDYDSVRRLAETHKPKLIIAGGSAYPRIIDFKKFREIANEVGAYLLVDMAHYAGLIATNHYPSPLEHAHIVTSTTHKTLRGPRGGLILTNDEDLAKKINSAIFPGLQGGPLMHVIAAKAVAFLEALQPEFITYSKQVVDNAKAMSKTLMNRGYDIITDGTDCHLILLNLHSKNISGKLAEESLGRANITCNKNSVPFDTKSPFITSGIRLGSPACTSRGFKLDEFEITGNLIADVLDNLQKYPEDNSKAEEIAKVEILKLCNKWPIYKFLENN